MRIETIRRSKDFQDVFKKGTRVRGKMFSLHLLEDPGARGISTGAAISKKYIPSAVKRNYIRRIINAYFRENGMCLKKGIKMVLRITGPARSTARKALSRAVREDIEQLVEKAGAVR